MDSASPNAATRQMRRFAGLVLWASVTLQTYELISRHFRSRQSISDWVMLVLWATITVLPTRWPRKVKLPIALLGIVAAGYNLYVAHIQLTSMCWALLSVLLPIAILLALRRWTTWLWVKSPWATLGLLVAGTAVGLYLFVMFGS